MSPLFHVATLVALTLPTQAAPEDPRASRIAPFVGEEVAAVLHLDLTSLEVNAVAHRVLDGVFDDREIDEATRDLDGWLEALRSAGAEEFFLLIDPADFPGMPAAIIPLAEGADAEAIGRVLCGEEDGSTFVSWPTCATVKGGVFAGSDAALERVRRVDLAPRPELVDAFEASGDGPARLLLIPSETQRRAFEEIMPTLLEPLGGGPTTTLTRGLRWAALLFEAEPNPTLRVVAQARDADAAHDLDQLAGDALVLLEQSFRQAESMRDAAEDLDQIEREVVDDRLVLSLDLERATALVGAPVRDARETAKRAQCTNNLKQIGIAMHNYLSSNKTFPPAYSTDADGTPLLSWRVHILPYLEQQSLYDEFHLDEPWDSPHNKTLIDRMPEIYLCPSAGSIEPGMTTYLVPRGEATIFHGAEGVTIKGIEDGTSNTILVVDAAPDHAVNWTRPDDWEVGETIDPDVLFGNHPGGTNAAFADGSVRFLSETIDLNVLRMLTTRSGGEVISADDF